ncbi:hypothetical protein [Nostoc sp.]|uniref:hypothetical protein n=1 Tax=Nostoc sp. TaxID=1180 RepID=UPI002FFA6F84
MEIIYKINSIELLREQQYDFIKRLKYDSLLNCQTAGTNSEITVVSELSTIRKIGSFSLSMFNKYKNPFEKDLSKENREIIEKNFIGKLGEEAVKSRLDKLVTEVDYTIKKYGDNKVDFKLISGVLLWWLSAIAKNVKLTPMIAIRPYNRFICCKVFWKWY